MLRFVLLLLACDLANADGGYKTGYCARDTGATCRIAECNPDRNAVCENGACVCTTGSCSDSDGICRAPSYVPTFKYRPSTEGGVWPYDGVCNKNTGGSCSWFACAATRNSVCISGACMCPAGKCSDSQGNCQFHIRAKDYCGTTWTMANMHLSDDGVFTKYAGNREKSDAWAITDTNGVRSISFSSDGGVGVREVGLTGKRTDLRDFPNGGFVSLDTDMRAVSPAGSTFFDKNDKFNLTVIDHPGNNLDGIRAYRNGAQFGTDMDLHFPRAMAAKIWMTDYSKIQILECHIMTDCIWANWGAWSPCSMSCGDGLHMRSRTYAQAGQYGGRACTGDVTQSETCKVIDCPVDCVWDSWAPWSDCTADCDGGERCRKRDFAQNPLNGGKPCVGATAETEECNMFPCKAQNCEWNEWSAWSDCSEVCEGGLRFETRGIKTHSSHGGAACSGNSKFVESCNTQPCPSVDCSWGPWTAWSSCSTPCGGGQMGRARQVLTPTLRSGGVCDASSSQIAECGLQVCADAVNWVYHDTQDLAQVFTETGSGGFAVTSTSNVIGISVKLEAGGSGSVTFGLTSVAADDDKFANGYGYTLAAGSSDLVTVGILGDQLAVYVGDTFKKYEKQTSETSMYAKVFLEKCAKAKIVGVLLAGAYSGPAPCQALAMIGAARASEPQVQPVALLNSDASTVSNSETPAMVNLPTSGAIFMIAGLMLVAFSVRRGLWSARGDLAQPFVQ